MRKLLLLSFIVGIGLNSLAGVVPHSNGEGGCAASCCEAARNGGPQARVARLCCMLDCNQPGGTSTPNPVNSIVMAPDSSNASAPRTFRLEPIFAARGPIFGDAPPRSAVDPPHLFLATGALLI